jgi:hypothetical protein
LTGDTNLVRGGSLFGDSIIAVLLLNEARHRLVAWVFGVPREDSNRMTAVAVGSLAEGVAGGAARVLGGAALPSAAAAALGAAAVKETVHGVAGDWSRTTPYFGALLVFAVLGTAFGPTLRTSLRGVRGGIHGITAGSRRVLAFLGGH